MARVSIGLDVGPHTVRAIALAAPTRHERHEGRVGRVVAHVAVARQADDGSPKPLSAVLKDVRTRLKVRGPTTLHLADAKVLFRYLSTLPLAADRTAKILRLELASHAAEDGDLAADAWVIPLPGEEILHGCALAAPVDVYAGLLDLREAGWAPPRITAGPVAAYNAIAPLAPARGDALHLVVHVGPQVTGLSLFGEDRLLACRTVAMGTEAFATALHADHRATSLPTPPPPPAPPARPAATPASSSSSDDGIAFTPLLDETPFASPAPAPVEGDTPFALELEDPAPVAPPTPVAPPLASSLSLELDDDAPSAAPASLPEPGQATMAQAVAELGPEAQRVAEQLAAQIASSLLWFRQQVRLPTITVSGLHLAGEGAALPGLDRYLARRFACPAASVQLHDGLSGDLPNDLPLWTTAIGLALAQPDRRGAVVLDLQPESMVAREARRRHVTWPLIAAGLVAFAAIPAGITGWRLRQAQEDSLAAWTAYQADHQKLSSDLATVDKERHALESDLRAIAGRIASGENLLLAIRALKELAPRSTQLWVVRMSTERLVAEDDAGGAPRPTTTRSNGTTVVADTAIDRGTLIIDVVVRFDLTPNTVEQDEFRQSYQKSLLTWAARPDAPSLFSDVKVRNFKLEDADLRKNHTTGTALKFTLVCTFRPADLSSFTTQHAGTP